MTEQVEVKNSTKRVLTRGGISFMPGETTVVKLSAYQKKEVLAAVGLTIAPKPKPEPEPIPEPVPEHEVDLEQEPEPEPAEPETKKASAKKGQAKKIAK